MAKNLVIVESPAKAKTIKKFLGKNYEVIASNGHVRDLPKSQMGIDVEHDFEPKYITIRGKGELLAALRKEVKKADKVYLGYGSWWNAAGYDEANCTVSNLKFYTEPITGKEYEEIEYTPEDVILNTSSDINYDINPFEGKNIK